MTKHSISTTQFVPFSVNFPDLRLDTLRSYVYISRQPDMIRLPVLFLNFSTKIGICADNMLFYSGNIHF